MLELLRNLEITAQYRQECLDALSLDRRLIEMSRERIMVAKKCIRFADDLMKVSSQANMRPDVPPAENPGPPPEEERPALAPTPDP